MSRFALSAALLAALAAGSTASAAHRRPRVHVSVLGPAHHFYPYYGAYYGYSPYFYNPYYSPYAYYYRDPYEVSGVRLKVRPNDAKVFVDGYYVGKVDDFDNSFQQLDLKPGRHEISVKHAGYRTYRVRLYAAPGRTMKIEHQLEKATGENEAAEPARR